MKMNMTLEARIAIEKRIVKKTIKTLINAGYSISVSDGDMGLLIRRSTNQKDIMENMMQMDEDFLICHKGEKRETIQFVYGNDGWDCIADYHCSLEEVLKPVNELAGKIEEKY